MTSPMGSPGEDLNQKYPFMSTDPNIQTPLVCSIKTESFADMPQSPETCHDPNGTLITSILSCNDDPTKSKTSICPSFGEDENRHV